MQSADDLTTNISSSSNLPTGGTSPLERAQDDRKVVLLVEDELDIRMLYAEVLTDAGYKVELAPDGNLAWQKIQDVKWDILLLDIIMPGKDGMQLLRLIKSQPEAKKGPIILLTAMSSEHVINEAFSMGADGYLIKSEISPDKIISEVKSFLNK